MPTKPPFVVYRNAERPFHEPVPLGVYAPATDTSRRMSGVSDLPVIAYRPEPAEFAWTFGGVKPVRSVTPGSVMELWTEDAFAGKVKGPDDLVSKVIEFPFV